MSKISSLESYIKKIQKDIEYAFDLDIVILIKVLKLAAEKYYNTQKPIMSDETYDNLVEILTDRDPKNKYLKEIGAPVRGDDVKLPYHMGSMDKKKEEKEIMKWEKKYKHPYVIGHKLDGISALFICKNGKKKLYTRGDGTHGKDISHLIKYLPSLNKICCSCAVRGELVMSKKKYQKYAQESANNRAWVNGAIGSKKVKKDVLLDIDFVAFELIEYWKDGESVTLPPSQQYIYLKKLKYNIVNHVVLKEELEIEKLQKILRKEKNSSKYEIDGIIVMSDKKHPRNTKGNPDYGFAFKEHGETKEVKVQKVEWRVSKDKKLKPRIHIKPTKLSGVTIQHLTGFNAKYIVENKVGPGTKILIVRSGEVIPHILKVITPTKAQLPKVSYQWNATRVDFIIKDGEKESESQVGKDYQIQKMVNFVKKMNIKDVDKKLITRFYEHGIKNMMDIITLTKTKLLTVEGIKDKMATKIYQHIQESLRNVPLERIMVATNIFGGTLGSRKLKAILKEYPDLITWKIGKDKIIEKIRLIDGFETKSATVLAEGLPEFQKFIKKLKTKKLITLESKKKKTNGSGGKYKDQKIVFSGFRNKEWQEFIEEQGGKVTTSVSKNTTKLVVSDLSETSSKITKAKDLNIPIVDKDNFEKEISKAMK